MVFNVDFLNIEEVDDISEKIKHMSFALGYVSKRFESFVDNSDIKRSLLDYHSDPNSCCFIAKDDRNDFSGICMAYTYKPIITNDKFKRAQDCLIQPCFTLSKKSKGKIFLLLLDRYERWAEDKSVQEIFIGINKKNDIRKSMARKGYELADYVLKKEV